MKPFKGPWKYDWHIPGCLPKNFWQNSKSTNCKICIEFSLVFHNRCLYNGGISIEAVDNWDRRVSRKCQLVRVLRQIWPGGVDGVKTEWFLSQYKIKLLPGHHGSMQHRHNHNIEGPEQETIVFFILSRNLLNIKIFSKSLADFNDNGVEVFLRLWDCYFEPLLCIAIFLITTWQPGRPRQQ